MPHADGPAPDPVALRRATPADAARLADFARRAFVEAFGPDNTPEDMAMYLPTAFSEAIQAREIADPAARVWLAEAPGGAAGGALAGYAVLHLAAASPSVAAARPAEIVRFYVDRPWQGRGVAGRLMDACLAEARAHGADVAWLGVFERNPRAIAFYERAGFRQVGTQTFVLGRDAQTDRVMARTLAPAPDR